MPVVELRCGKCQAHFDALVGVVKDETPESCPSCGSQCLESVPVAGVPIGIMDRFREIPAGERESAVRHRKWLEENQHLRESGELNVKEAGPDEFRPFGNAPRARKFY